MRLRARKDGNQDEIANALEGAGVSVDRSFTRLGGGCPDLCCSYHNRIFLLEVKRPGEGLNDTEKKWHRKFPGAFIVTTWQEAFRAVGVPLRKVG